MGARRKRGHATDPQPRLSKARLDELVEEALVDTYGESEQVTGFYTMMENDLQLGFETEILGITMIVESIDITEDDQLVAVCRKDKTKQRISLSELPLPSPPPKGAEWIDAYRYWRTGKIRMSTRVRKHVGAHSARRDTNLRRDVQEAFDRIWPDGIVEMLFDPNESYYFELSPKLSRALRRIRSTVLLYEREADGGPVWWEGSDPEEDPPSEIERSRSYHTFFISPDGKGFTFETEADGVTESEFMTDDFAEAGWGEEPPVSRVSGSGRIGWVVAVSLLAPFAVIELGDVVTFEDGSTTEPEIESYGQTPAGELIEEVYGARAYKTIISLRATIAEMLEGFGIAVLPPEEWLKPAPWLRGTEETLIGIDGKAIRVLDALFFESL